MSAGNGRTELCDYEHEMSVLSQLDDVEKTIEAQQQEIELLKIARDNWKKTAEIWDKALKQARVALEEIEKCCEINVDDGYHTCQRKCREAAARVRFVREVIDELEGSE
jgi:hypothetical protein